MANQWQNPVIIADKILEFFDGLSEVAPKINRDYESTFTASKESLGQTIYVEKPPRFTAQDGPIVTAVQDINVGKIPVIINKWKTVPVKLTGLDLTFNAKSFDIWAEKYLKPIVSPLANAVDVDIFGLWNQIYNQVGTCGTGFGATAATAFDLMAAARQKLTLVGNTPQDGRIAFVNPTGARSFGTAVAVGFNPQAAIGSTAQSGVPYRTAGFDMYEANNIGIMTAGTLVTGDTPTVATTGAVQQGSALNVASVTTHTLTVGQVFNIAGVFSVNPTSKASTGLLQDFRVTQAFTGNTTGTIQIDPPIIPTGPFQNVTNGPATSSALTFAGVPTASATYPQHLAFWPKALGLVTVPIKPPDGLKGVTRSYNGVSITITTGSDIYQYEQIWRADIVYGVVAFYPENCVRIIGS
jgi:hypothetical protein